MKPSRAFVLGAGLGTRLRPLTEHRPKPLVPVYGKPLITFAFDHLMGAGIRDFVVNTHHAPEEFPRILGGTREETSYRGDRIRFRHEPVLLDTGGGIRNVRDLLGEQTFLTYNGDVLADLPLEPALTEHETYGNLATLVLRSTGGPLHVKFDPDSGLVTDVRDRIGGARGRDCLFTGIAVLSPEVINEIPAEGPASIVDVYLKLIRRGARIGACLIDEGQWFDLGSHESYFGVHRWLQTNRLRYMPSDWPSSLADDAVIGDGVTLVGLVAAGPRAAIGSGATLRDCILWEDAKVADGATLENCIVRDGRTAKGVLNNTIL